MSYIGRTPTNAALTASDLADGIGDPQVRNRGTITQIINNAVNERGSKNLI